MKTAAIRTPILWKTQTSRIIACYTLFMLTLLLLSGCKSNQQPAAPVDPSGVYTLVSVDGQNSPCKLMHGGTEMTIHSGAFTLNADGTCSSLMKFSVAGHEDATREVKATYTRAGDTLTMKWERAGMTTGKLAGKTFTMINEGMVFVYQK